MLMKNSFICFALVVAFCGILLSGSLNAQLQNIDVNPTLTFVRHFESGTPLAAFEIGTNIVISSAVNVEWSYCIDDPLPMSSPVHCSKGLQVVTSENTPISLDKGLVATFLDSGSDKKVRITSTAPVEGVVNLSLRLVVNPGPSESVHDRSYQFIIRHPLQMVFVLDRSGSMECGATGNSVDDWDACINCPTSTAGTCSATCPPGKCGRRWDMLADAVENFCTKIDPTHHLVGNDRFSVVYFAGESALSPPFDLDDLNTFVNFTTFNGGILSNMTTTNISVPQLGRTGTSIGDGLNEAFTYRFETNRTDRRQVILLFTDGEQNATEMISIDGTNWSIGGGNLTRNSFPGVEIYTVGFGSTHGMNNLLAEIASAGGNYYNVSDIIGTSNHVFNQIFHNFSPDNIRIDEQILRTENEATFVCNKNVSRLFFEAHFNYPLAKNRRYKIQKNGEDLTHYAQPVKIGRYYATLIINFQDHPELESEGEWMFTVEQPQFDDVAPAIIQTQSRYRIKLIATADDHLLDFSTSAGKERLRVNDKMEPTVRLQYRGQPVENATVSALILKPGDDLNDILARTEAPVNSDAHPESGPGSTQKYTYLNLNNSAVLDSFRIAVQNLIQLDHKGDGIYSGSFDNLDVSGIYRIYFSVKADIPEVGLVERFKEQTVNVRFGDIDLGLNWPGKETMLENDVVLKNERRLTVEGNRALLYFRPAYMAGNRKRYAGPGLWYGIQAKGEGVEKLNVTDNYDGSYDLELKVDNPNPRVRISMFDQEVYQGKLLDFDRLEPFYRFNASLHAGATFPLTDLDSLYNGGFFAEADFGYRLTPGLSLEAVAGYYGFSDNFYILGGTLYAKGSASIGSGGFMVTGAIGGGLYKPKGEDTSAGYSVRLALSKHINARLAVSLDGAWFHLIDPGYSFATLGVGLKYFF
jgi:hypothetical protein